MTLSERTCLVNRPNFDDAVAADREESVSCSSSAKGSFLVGLFGVLVGAVLVSFSNSHQQSHYRAQSDNYRASIPLLGKKHHHGSKNKEDTVKTVVDQGNWIEEFGVSRAIMVETRGVPPRTLYASGQTAFNGTDLVGNDMAGQMAAAIANVDQTLRMAGMTKCNIVKLYVFVTSTDAVLAEWEQYETWLQDCPGAAPANTLVAIESLFRPDALIEIDVTAIL